MHTATTLESHIGWSDEGRAGDALGSIFDGVGTTDADLGVVFLSSRFDLDDAATAIRKTFSCPVLACTTAGELSRRGYHQGGLVAATLQGVKVSTAYIDDVSRFTSADARTVTRQLDIEPGDHDERRAAILLIDGLCLAEEYASAHLYHALGEMPMGGGSAGDDAKFARTHVFDGDKFRSGGAMEAVVESPAPIHVFAHQHYLTTDTQLVVTGANPERRIILEINGQTAAVAYAQALGLDVHALGTAFVSTHPLIYRVGQHTYVRGIQSVLPNGGMQLFCAIEEGVVLAVGAPDDMGCQLNELVHGRDFSDPALVIGFDCIQRCAESEAAGCTAELTDAYSNLPLIGFSTYGEQYNGLHVNQTITGLVFRNA